MDRPVNAPAPAQTDIEGVLEHANMLRQQRRYHEAAELLLGALHRDAPADKIFFQLGNTYFDAGDLARAEYSYKRAREINPKHAPALHNLAVVYKQQNKVAAAIKLQRAAMHEELRASRERGRVLAPEVAAWARGVALRGLAVVAGVFALIAFLLYLYFR